MGTPQPPSERIRLVLPRYGREIIGGHEKSIRDLAIQLARRNWGVEVWTTTAQPESTWAQGYPAGISEEDGVKLRRFAVAGPRHPQRFHQLSRLFFRLPSGLRPERYWVREQGPRSPELIRALATAPGMPTIFSPYLFYPTLCGLPAAFRAGTATRIMIPAAHDERPLRLRMVREALALCTALWFHTPEEAELVHRVHPFTRNTNSAVGIYGLEVQAGEAPDGFAREHGIDHPYLYFGGRQAVGKLGTLVADFQALRSTTAVELLLSGELHVEGVPGITNLGDIGGAQRRRAIAGALAVVVPSRLESLSLLALEAWAAGKPCILNGESPVLAGHLQRSQAGFLYRNPQELQAAVSALLHQPGLAAEMGERGRRYVRETYSWDESEARLRGLISI